MERKVLGCLLGFIDMLPLLVSKYSRLRSYRYVEFGLEAILRALALRNATLSYFTIPKSYFIDYTIPFYNTPYIQKLYYFTFSLKYYFF